MSKNIMKIDGIYNELDLVWTAAIIDGEGSILLTKERKSANPSPAISVANTSLELLNKLQKLFGGSICRVKKYKKHHVQSYVWRLNYYRAIEVMQLIIPHLVIPKKRKRAKLIVRRYKQLVVRNGKYSDKQQRAYDKFVQKFYSLS